MSWGPASVYIPCRVDFLFMLQSSLFAGGTVAQVALAWLLRQPAVTSVIIGATKLTQLEDNIKAAFLELSEEQVQTDTE